MPAYTSNIVEEVAEYLYKHPFEDKASVIDYFCHRTGKSKRTVLRYYDAAIEKKSPIIEAEKQGRLEAIKEAAKEAAKEKAKEEATVDILTRAEGLEILTQIARGKPIRVDGKIILTKASDRIGAVEKLTKILDWQSEVPAITKNEAEEARGRILQKQLPVFMPLFLDPYNYMDLIGGRGRGASYAMSSFIIYGCLGSDYFRAVLMRYNDTSIGTGIWQDIVDRINEFELHKFFKVTSAPRRIVNKENGNIITASGFIGSQEKMKGLAGFNVVGVDEANEVPEFLMNKLMDTIRTIKGENKFIRAFNPPSKRHWLWKDYSIEPVEGGYRYKPKENGNIKAIISDYMDNYYLSDSYLQRIELKKEQDRNYFNSQYAGLITDNPAGRIFTWDTITKEQWDNVDGGRVFGLDFGFSSDPNALVEIKIDGENLFVREHLYARHQPDKCLIDSLLHVGVKGDDIIIADCSADTRIYNISTCIDGTHPDYKDGFTIYPCQKGAGSIVNGIETVKQYKLHILETSDNLIDELSEYNWLIDKDGNVTDKPIDKNNHLIDAMRYAVSYARLAGI